MNIYISRQFRIIAMMLFCVSTLFAQQNKTSVLEGSVTTGKTPLSYATIYLKNTTISTSTDEYGKFSFSIPSGTHTLCVSYLGYVTHETSVTIRAGEKKTVHLKLKENAGSLDEVVVQGKSSIQQVKESAFNVVALDVKKFHNTTGELKDILARAPGSRIRESGGVGSDMAFLLDGFSGRHVKFFIDGVPLDTRNSSFNINNIPVNFAERIEIYRGVVPIEFGSDALGGVVNIVTASNKKKTFVDASYSYGSFNTHKSYLNVGHTTEKGMMVDFNLYQNYSDNSYYTYTSVEDLENGQIDKSKIEKVKRFNDTYHNEAIVGKIGFVNKSFADRILFGINLSQSYKEIQNGVRQEIVYGQRKHKAKSIIPSFEYRKRNLLTEGLNASLTANYNYSQTHMLDTATYKYNWRGESVYNNGKRGEQSFQNTKNDNNYWNATGNVSYRIGTMHNMALNHLLTTSSRKNKGSSESQGQNGITNVSRKNITGLSYRFRYNSNWNISLLGKYYSQYNSGERNVSEDETRPSYAEASKSSAAFGYGTALTYFFLKNFQVKLSFENALRLPTGNELFGDEDLELGNIDIKPERSDNFNFNISCNHNFDKHGIYWEGGFIYRNTKDYIRRVTNRYSGGLYYGSYENHGNVITKGFSTELRYTYSKWFLLGGNLTYQEAVNNEKYINGYEGRVSSTYKERMPNTPYFYFNIDAAFFVHDLLDKGNILTFNYANSYVKEFSLYWENEGSSNSKLRVPNQFSHNLSLIYSIKGQYNISFECQNFTDERLYDNFSQQKAGRAFYGKVRYFFGK